MNKYLLLRNNKQTGPHSLAEIQDMGLRRYDLIWVEGKSAAWRYAGEIEEMKSFAPLVEEQPFDRFYKRPPKEEQNNLREEKKQLKTEAQEEKTQPQHLPSPAAKRQERLESQPNQERKSKKYVSISMPAGKGNMAIPPPVKPEKKHQPAPVSAAPLAYTQISVPATEDFPVTSAGRFMDVNIENYKEQSLNKDPQEWIRKNYQQILQYVGIGLALASLLVVGVLIGMGVNSDPVRPPVYQSQQKPVANPQSDPSDSPEESTGIIGIPASNNLPQEELNDEPIQAKDYEKISPAVSNTKNTTKQQANTSSGSGVGKNPEDGTRDIKPDVTNKIITPSPVPTETAKPASLSSEVSVKLNDYKTNVFGGIDNIEVTVSNRSAFVLDLVVVEVDYIQSNKKLYKTETVRLKNIAPGASANAPAPKTTRGIRINSRITYITSAKAGISENL